MQHLGVEDEDVLLVSVPGALEIPLALRKMAESGQFDALIALGAVIRGETYHFEIVSNESCAGITRVQLDTGVPIANGILTTENEEQAIRRAEQEVSSRRYSTAIADAYNRAANKAASAAQYQRHSRAGCDRSGLLSDPDAL